MPAGGEIHGNPLNVRIGNDWQGEVPWERMTKDQREWAAKGFEVFEAPEWGIRAAVKLLDAYRRRHGLTTIAGIINRWAPPSENDTAAYVRKVAADVGVSPHAEIDTTDPQVLLSLLESMISVEIGRQPYPEHVLWQGIRLADGKETEPMNPPKHPLASKTLWVNVVAGIAAVGTAFGLDLGLDAEQQTAIVGGIMALVNIVLRFVTKQPIGGQK